MNEPDLLKVCYILSYYSPNYSRTSALITALKKIEGIVLYEARNESVGLRRYVETIIRLIQVRITYEPDIYLLGFRGVEIYWLVRLLTLGKPLYYDQMMSPYDSLVNETQMFRKDGLIAKLLHTYERSVLLNCTRVLTDTPLHKSYFVDTFSLPEERVASLHLSANEDLFNGTSTIQPNTDPNQFTVLFYGSFLPLHGINIILEAARALKRQPITFLMFGGKGKELADFHEKRSTWNLHNIHYEEWIDQQDLPALIESVDLCLGGPFGNTGQAQRVITNKTFESLAMGKATVVGALDEDYGFRDKANCLLVEQGDAEGLANAISWAACQRDRLSEIGTAGRQLYLDKFSSDCAAERLKDIILE